MENSKLIKAKLERTPRGIQVWDLPTRLFHWLLVIFLIISFVTGNMGGNAMQYHEWSGFAILTLLLFRLVWGFVGSRESRFMAFIRLRLNTLQLAAGMNGKANRAEAR